MVVSVQTSRPQPDLRDQFLAASHIPPSVGTPSCSLSHQAIVDMIQATYLWGSRPKSLGNPNWAGSVLGVIVKTQINKVSSGGGGGWGGCGSAQLSRLGRRRHLTRSKYSIWVLFWCKHFSSGNFVLVFGMGLSGLLCSFGAWPREGHHLLSVLKDQ